MVLVSSILTDAGAWGQLDSAGYKITNAFGHVLEEKLVAENALRKSGLDWTIVRPGGLKADPPTGALFVSGENTLNSGESAPPSQFTFTHKLVKFHPKNARSCGAAR